MKSLKEVLSIFKRSFSTGLDVGPQVKGDLESAAQSNKKYSYGCDLDKNEGFPDNLDQHIKIFRFGFWPENKLYMKVVNSKTNEEFYGFVDSPVLTPCMQDRFFGIDAWEAHACSELYDIMTLMYKEELGSSWEYNPQ